MFWRYGLLALVVRPVGADESVPAALGTDLTVQFEARTTGFALVGTEFTVGTVCNRRDESGKSIHHGITCHS